MSTSQTARKAFLAVSFVVNFGTLAVFKYYNFFIDSLTTALQHSGFGRYELRLDVVLPVGISFYTFKTVSSSIDVYRGQLKPPRDFIAFLSFVTFFPQLLAGPIERAGHLLPQFLKPRYFDGQKAADGLRQALWGMFKKVVIADNCAVLANQTFGNCETFSGVSLLLGAYFFAIQIYCDFSGYSDIAVGISRLFGFSPIQNFAFPYFSRDIAEFWRRWHISLSTWFRDYVYVPLGGSRCSRPKMIRNTILVFLISGLWHGANWTFIVWGLLHALYFLPLQIAGKNRTHLAHNAEIHWLPTIREVRQISLTFFLIMLSWVFFRAATVSDAIHYLERIFLISSGQQLSVPPELWGLTTGFFLIEWLQRSKQHGLEINPGAVPWWARSMIYYCLIVLILQFAGDQQGFIYFQF